VITGQITILPHYVKTEGGLQKSAKELISLRSHSQSTVTIIQSQQSPRSLQFTEVSGISVTSYRLAEQTSLSMIQARKQIFKSIMSHPDGVLSEGVFRSSLKRR
jgi:hypothetical protein